MFFFSYGEHDKIHDTPIKDYLNERHQECLTVTQVDKVADLSPPGLVLHFAEVSSTAAQWTELREMSRSSAVQDGNGDKKRWRRDRGRSQGV